MGFIDDSLKHFKEFSDKFGDRRQRRILPDVPGVELDPKPDILTIVLKDLDSVPEVWYKGERIFEDRLKSIEYGWATNEDDSLGKQLLEIIGYDIDGYKGNQYLSTDTVKHEREP